MDNVVDEWIVRCAAMLEHLKSEAGVKVKASLKSTQWHKLLSFSIGKLLGNRAALQGKYYK